VTIPIPCCLTVLTRVQEQLTSRWEENRALATSTRDQLAQYEAGLMDLREALNQAVNTTREAEELNSRNQELVEEALVRAPPPQLPAFPTTPPHLCPPLHPPSRPPPSPTSQSAPCTHTSYPVTALCSHPTPNSALSNGSGSCPGTMPP
jgi:hypothetical protein